MELCVRHHRNRTRRTPANHEIVGERHIGPVSSEEVHDEHTTTGSLFHRQEAYRGAGTVEPGSGDDLADYDRDFLVVGVTSCLPLRIREAIVDHDLENAPLARDERQLLHIMLEFLEQLIGHAHGTVSIASSGAVFECDLHGSRLGVAVALFATRDQPPKTWVVQILPSASTQTPTPRWVNAGFTMLL